MSQRKKTEINPTSGSATGDTDQSGIVTAVKNKLNYWSTQYELALCISLFEPWEKCVINSLVGGSVFMMAYSTIVYLPNYLASLFNKIVNLHT